MYSFLEFALLYSLCSFYVQVEVGLKLYTGFDPKTAGEWWGQFRPPPCGLPKNVSSKKRVEPWFFVTFNIIISHIFPENFTEVP